MNSTIPDGGRGWYAVLGTFLAHVVGLGSLYSFGVLFPIIVEEFGRGQGTTAWVIGVGQSVMLVMARPAGRAVDRFGPGRVVLVGATAVAGGYVVSSIAGSVLVVILAFGLLVGPGLAVAFVPGVATVSQWFERRRGLALGIAVSGSGVGTFLVAPLLDFWIRTGGWRTAMRWVALMVFGVMLVVSRILVPGPGKTRAATGERLRALLSNRNFRQIFTMHALMGFSFMVPFIYLVPFARDQGIEPQTAAWLLAIMGLSGVAGRVVLGAFGDRVGPVIAITITTAGMAVGHAIWIGVGSLPGLLLVAVVYGWFAGAYAALVPALTAQYLGMEDFASVVGAVYSASAAGMLVAPPLVGAIFDVRGSYVVGIAISMSLIIVVVGLLLRLQASTRPTPRSQPTSS